MKLAYLIQKVYSEPALIMPEAHAAIRQLLEERLGADAGLAIQPEAAKRQANICGDMVDLPSMQVVDGIAHIPIGGAIGYKLDDFAKWAGAVDVLDVMRDIDEAEADANVRGVLFDVDSPGGMVTGTAELADRILAMAKPKVAFTDGMMASAAYWISAATNWITASRSAQVGSIGVYLPVYDTADYYEQRGIKVELIKAGRLKGLGFPGTRLSDDGRAHLQGVVNGLYDAFTAHVRAMRGADVAEATMQGQVFYAPEGKDRKLVNQIGNKAAAVDSLRALMAA